MSEDTDNTQDILSEVPAQLYDLIKESRNRCEQPLDPHNGPVTLRSTEPVSVVEYFLTTIKGKKSEATFNDYSYDLTRFLEYCFNAGIDDLSELSSRDIEGFKDWRQQDGNITLTTLEGQLANIRVFIRKCERLEIIDEGLADSIETPDLDRSDEVSYVRLCEDKADLILDHHRGIDYNALHDDTVAPWVVRGFTEFSLMWGLLCRLGDCRALDVTDYKTDDDGNKYIEIHHRPETDTPLKNQENDVEGHGGERQLTVPDWLAEILDQYIEHHRIEIEDEYGRRPLFSTKHGRAATSTIRRDIYRITQPCRYGQTCPVDRDPDDCQARSKSNAASKCPDNTSPHPVRRGGICHQLNEGVPKEKICERADVSLAVLNKHYDLRTKEEARKQRRGALAKHLDGYGDDASPTALTIGDQLARTMGNLVRASPLVANLSTAASLCREAVGQADQSLPMNQRVATGLAGYGVFTVLVGLNFGLMGIGFDPVSMDLIIDI